MKKGRRLISMLMLLAVMVSALSTSVHAGSVGRIGQRKVKSISQSYTGGSSQVYANLITKADGTEVRYVYSKYYLNAPDAGGTEDSFGVLKRVLSDDYAALIPDKVDDSRKAELGFFFCSDPTLEKYVNDNWTSAEYVARNFLTVQKEGTSYTYKSEGEGTGGAINTSATTTRQNKESRFELIKTLVEEADRLKWEAREEVQQGTYVGLDFGNLSGDDIQGIKDLTDNQLDLVLGCNLTPGFEVIEGKLIEVTNIETIDHVATIYSEHAIISASESSSVDEKESQEATASETAEKKVLAMNAGFKVTQKGSKIKIEWGKVEGADNYEVFVAYCGKKFSKKATKTTKKNSVTIKKLNGKKINLKKNFKVKVIATKDGENQANTIEGHVVGRKNAKYTNAKDIKLTTTAISVKKGETAKIKAKTILVDKKKKQLTNAHAKEFRYASSDKSIATVSAKGEVTGVNTGTCTVYVYSRNGLAKEVQVTVE